MKSQISSRTSRGRSLRRRGGDREGAEECGTVVMGKCVECRGTRLKVGLVGWRWRKRITAGRQGRQRGSVEEGSSRLKTALHTTP